MADIFNAQAGNAVIKNGTAVVMVSVKTFQDKDDDVKNTPTIADIQNKYANRFKENTVE